MRKTWLLCGFLALCTASGCAGCDDRGAAPAPVSSAGEATPLEESITPADPLLQTLASLDERARLVASEGSKASTSRSSFKRDSIAFGNRVLGDMRLDVVVGVAEALWRAGEGEVAAAFLQRAVGLLQGKTTEKKHMHALALLKVELGRALEAASLMERAVDIEPTTPRDFVLLSWAYLRSGRLGPAAAATRRGARGHAGAPELAVQAAEVLLLKSNAENALEALAAIQPEPASEQFYRVRGEAHLITGNRDQASVDAKTLVTKFPGSPWGPLLESAAGGLGRADAQGHAVRLSVESLSSVDGRAALAWAEAAEDSVSPWKRSLGTEQKAAPKRVTLDPFSEALTPEGLKPGAPPSVNP